MHVGMASSVDEGLLNLSKISHLFLCYIIDDRRTTQTRMAVTMTTRKTKIWDPRTVRTSSGIIEEEKKDELSCKKKEGAGKGTKEGGKNLKAKKRLVKNSVILQSQSCRSRHWRISQGREESKRGRMRTKKGKCHYNQPTAKIMTVMIATAKRKYWDKKRP